MIKQIPLWLISGLSVAFLIYASTVLAFFMIGHALSESTFIYNLMVSLLKPFYEYEVIFIGVLVGAFVIGAMIGLIAERFFIINITRKNNIVTGF